MTITMQRDRGLTFRDLLNIQDFGPIDESGGFTELLDTPIAAFAGAAQGFNESGDIITETEDGFPLNSMWDEFQRTIQIWNAQRNALTDPFTYDVKKNVEGVRYPEQEDFEEADEFGVPKGQRLGPAFKMGYDFKWWDLATRYTWRFLAETDAAQLRALHNQALEADNRLVFQRVMRAIFNDVTRVAEIDGVDVNVYPFYNGDTMVPPSWKLTTFSTGHEHYVTSGGATVVSGDLDDLQGLLTEHGYTTTNGYQLLLFVNEAQGTVIRGFTRGGGAKYDFIPTSNVGGGIILAANGGIIGAPTMVNLPGLMTIGSYGQFVIIEESYIPAGYMLALASKGPNNIDNPVGIRVHEKAALRGLKLLKGAQHDYPLIDSYYSHAFGTGVRHRGAGAVMQITAAGSYTIPAAYA
jgi:hypothetical protein